MGIRTDIARAIKRADNRYFFEDYSKQAKSVMRALDKEGYQILPRELDEKILREVADTIATGKMRPEKHIENVYATLIQVLTRNGTFK